MGRWLVSATICAVLLSSGCVGRTAIPFSKGKRPIPKIMPRSAWTNSMPSGSYQNQQPAYITLMDTPSGYDPGNPGAYLNQLIKDYIDGKGVGDVPIHYIIDQEGHILAGRPTNTVGQLSYGDRFFRSEVPENHPMYGKPINAQGHILVLVLGDYETDPMPKKQEEAMVELIRYLINEHRLSVLDVLGLRSYLRDCANPGTYLNDHLASAMLHLAQAGSKAKR
ncbi:MAG: N-acetylmuramoyl-L-alanine amidase [bacterium]